jgi:ABC-2 type transport system ATP-binding protein
MSERRISLDTTARSVTRLRSLLPGLDLDAASTPHAGAMSIDFQMTTEQVRGPAIHVQGLEKSYKELHVLRGVDFDVARGSIFALLGPNGAGKTMVVRILSTLLRADAGTTSVNGFDVVTQAANVRESMSLTGQFAAVDEILSGRENLVLVARLRHLKDAGRIADDLLARFGLNDAAERKVSAYSGGMRRRLDIAMSLIGDPPVIFLDEPTTGLDPQVRVEVWNSVKELAEGGTTVLLTTQHLDEAEQLADRISRPRRRRTSGSRRPDSSTTARQAVNPLPCTSGPGKKYWTASARSGRPHLPPIAHYGASLGLGAHNHPDLPI